MTMQIQLPDDLARAIQEASRSSGVRTVVRRLHDLGEPVSGRAAVRELLDRGHQAGLVPDAGAIEFV